MKKTILFFLFSFSCIHAMQQTKDKIVPTTPLIIGTVTNNRNAILTILIDEEKIALHPQDSITLNRAPQGVSDNITEIAGIDFYENDLHILSLDYEKKAKSKNNLRSIIVLAGIRRDIQQFKPYIPYSEVRVDITIEQYLKASRFKKTLLPKQK